MLKLPHSNNVVSHIERVRRMKFFTLMLQLFMYGLILPLEPCGRIPQPLFLIHRNSCLKL